MFAQAVLTLGLQGQSPDVLGAYHVPGSTVYAAVDAEPPDHPSIEFYDAKTQRLGTLVHVTGDEYRTDGVPALTLRLDAPADPITETRLDFGSGDDRLGASLWTTPGAKGRATVILIQGADDSTRQMGFLIPYFVSHGLNVASYDQRGTGNSSGNWRYTSPAAKADDILRLVDAIKASPAVDPDRVGAWAASNGGWVAPIVATRTRLAFLILKSAPSGSIIENVLYEIEQDLREGGRFTAQQIADALTFERTMFSALETDSTWDAAGIALNAAKAEPWFSHMRIPPGMTTPPAAPMLAGLRAALVYDPASTLEKLHAPTLAIFGALDKNVDALRSATRLRKAFEKSGESDLTIVTFPHAGHLLVASQTGYEDDPSLPVHYVGYPEVMIHWLDKRGFTI